MIDDDYTDFKAQIDLISNPADKQIALAVYDELERVTEILRTILRIWPFTEPAIDLSADRCLM